MIRRSWIVAAPVAMAVATLAVFAGARSGAAEERSGATLRAQRTLELTAERSVFSLTGTPAVATNFVSGGELSDTSGAVVGRGFSDCGIVEVNTAVPPSFTAQCSSTFVLTDGELHLSSLRTYDPLGAGFNEAKIAVVGGTGAYSTARGEGTATRTGTNPVGYSFKFAITTDG